MIGPTRAIRERVAREEAIGDALAEHLYLPRHDAWELAELREAKRISLNLWAGESDRTKQQALLTVVAKLDAVITANERFEDRLHRTDTALWHHLVEKANAQREV